MKLAVAALMFVAFGVIGAAQAPADLAGTWKILGSPVTPAPPPPTPPTSKDVPPPPPPPKTLSLTITQTPTEVKIARAVESGGREAAYTFTYKLDGSESVNQMGSLHFRTKASWKDGALVLVSAVAVGEKPIGGQTDVYRIENGDLIVDTTRQMAEGQVVISKATFRKGQ